MVLSLVRSNPTGQVGFLAEPRRLNVAITRAKRHVAVIANVETVAHDPVLQGLVEFLEKHGEMRSAMQYEHLVKEINILRPDGLELTLKDAVEWEISKSASSSISNGAKTKASNKVQPKAKSIKDSNFKEPGRNSSKLPISEDTLRQKSTFFPKNHVLKTPIFIKFIFRKSHF